MSKIEKFKICRGCRTGGGSNNRENRRACLITIPVLSPTQQCPCITCLIKGMCMKGCEEYREYGKVLARRIHNE